MYDPNEFDSLAVRLRDEKIRFTVENAGGGCMVLFVTFADQSELSITRSEERNPDPANHWMVCNNANRDAFWEDGSVLVSRCADTDYVIEMIRSRGA